MPISSLTIRTTRRAAMLAALALAARDATAQSRISMTDTRIAHENKRIIADAFERWRNGTQSIYDLLADDATWTIVGTSKGAGTYHGREAFLASVIRPFVARMSRQLVPTVRGLYADGEMVVVLFDAVALAKDGRPYENTYSWYLQVRDGRIVGATAFFDAPTFDDLWTRVAP